MKCSKWLLLLALVAVLGAIYYQSRRMGGGHENVGAVDEVVKLAVHAFDQRLESEKSNDRWVLRFGSSTVAVDEDAGLVVRRDQTGKVEWSTRLSDTLRNWWWPGLVTDGRLIYVKQQFECVTALDATTGLVVWRTPVPAECFRLSGNLLLLANGPMVVALATESGVEVFRLPIPAASGFRPVTIEDTSGLFLVQTSESPGGEGSAFLFDRTGTIRHHFTRQIVSVLPLGSDRLFLTSADVRRVTSDDKTVWSSPFKFPEWIASGAIMGTPDGSLLAFLFGGINNSGVQVMRFDPVSGEAKWNAVCRPLNNVRHSEYQHDATAEWTGDRLRVISRGSAGTFVEWIDGGTGRMISRSEQRGK